MLTYDMTQRGSHSLYEYLYLCIRHDIAHGTIAPHEKLPSKRALADHLGISVITVEAAYSQLVAEGYVLAEPRRGYFACELAPALQAKEVTHQESRCAPVTENHGRDAGESRQSGIPLLADFTMQATETDLFPYDAWAKTMRRTLAEESAASLVSEQAPAGSWRLRRAIAHYLQGSRGMEVAPERIVVGASTQALYSYIVRLIGHDRTFAVEDPGYPYLVGTYRALGVTVKPVPLDREGMNIEALRVSGADIAQLMPAHQFPTGIVTSAQRRRDLLNWAREDRADRYLIEDDYDGKFRFAGYPISTLYTIDAADRTIYIGALEKGLAAVFCIGYMVLPVNLADRFDQDAEVYADTVSPLDQVALAWFLETGAYERYINRLRVHARKAQHAFVKALRESRVGSRLFFEGLEGGMHFMMRVHCDSDCRVAPDKRERAIANEACRHGVALMSLSDCYVSHAHTGDSAFVMNYSALDLTRLDEIADVIDDAIACVVGESCSQK